MPKRKRCTRCQKKKPATEKYFRQLKTRLAAECRQCAVDRSTEWRKANPERARATNTASTRRWRREHPEQYKIHRNRIRTRQRAEQRSYKQRVAHLPRDLTYSEWQETLAYFDHRCAYCRRRRKLQQEHVIPVSQGGGYTKANIIPACASCNYKKGGRTPEQAGMQIRKPWPIASHPQMGRCRPSSPRRSSDRRSPSY